MSSQKTWIEILLIKYWSVSEYSYAELYLLITEWILTFQNSEESEKSFSRFLRKKNVFISVIDLYFVLAIRIYRTLYQAKRLKFMYFLFGSRTLLYSNKKLFFIDLFIKILLHQNIDVKYNIFNFVTLILRLVLIYYYSVVNFHQSRVYFHD